MEPLLQIELEVLGIVAVSVCVLVYSLLQTFNVWGMQARVREERNELSRWGTEREEFFCDREAKVTISEQAWAKKLSDVQSARSRLDTERNSLEEVKKAWQAVQEGMITHLDWSPAEISSEASMVIDPAAELSAPETALNPISEAEPEKVETRPIEQPTGEAQDTPITQEPAPDILQELMLPSTCARILELQKQKKSLRQIAREIGLPGPSSVIWRIQQHTKGKCECPQQASTIDAITRA